MQILLHSLFEQQANKNPNGIALKSGEQNLTYREVNEQSNQLANYLCTNGVKEGDIVKICIERSFQMIIGILGILKSGAAYLPIDPNIPEERLAFLMVDSISLICVTREKYCQKIHKVASEQSIVSLDTDWLEIKNHSSEAPKVNIQDNRVAIILYTSGSTGSPKGVLLPHRSLVNRLLWDSEFYNHSINDIVLQHASYTFDFSVFEIFTALANGGKLVLARPEFHYEGFYLIELIQREKITKMASVPSLLKSYIKFSGFEKCTSLKQVFLGGEVLDSNLEKAFFQKSSAELINTYGPTETTISVLNWTCKRVSKGDIIPIGFPVANMRVYILNKNREPVIDGEIGEIYISGVGVSNGYHNRPDLSAEHFLNDPFNSDEDFCMYKSGDLGKKLSNGAIQFLGRMDSQVKIRGLRVELREIEHNLDSHESIRSCVVNAIKHDEGELKIVAYVVPFFDKKVDIEEIKHYLQSKLPDYMVPSLFVQLSDFPLSPNGKIDRKGLPFPDKNRLISQVSYISPENQTQRSLIAIWEKVLKINPIGITDSYDFLGGDSLASVEIHYLMESEMGCKLPFSSFVKANTIKEHAKIIDADIRLKHTSEVISLRKKGEKTPVVFVDVPHNEGVALAKKLEKYLDKRHPLLATLPFGLDPNTIPDSIEKCAEYYAKAIEDQFPSDEYILGGYSMAGLIALQIALILQQKGKVINIVFLLDTRHPEMINEYRNQRLFSSRFFFYSKKILNSDWESKKNIMLYLKDKVIKRKLSNRTTWLKQFNFFITKKNPPPPKKGMFSKSMNISLAARFKLSPYHGDVILISASEQMQPSPLNNELKKIENRMWKDDVIGKLNFYEIPATHDSIKADDNMKIVANIINDYTLKGSF
ncbi:MAG: amino acid adenylation domain-containing protein [Cyclobacteriaceae bacterium]|jgi:amino acid adenylation domain-containing protein